MRAQARELFLEMVRDCGPAIARMESSCNMYLGQYLANFPEERQVLSTALQYGAPEAITEFNSPTGYADHLATLTERFARRAQLDPDAAAWAIEAWAEALGRPAGSEVAAPPEFEKVYPTDGPVKGQAFADAAMLAIVGGGGFAGAFAAFMLLPIILWAADFGGLILDDWEAREGRSSGMSRQMVIFLVCGLVGLGAGALAAGAAVGAWLFAGGDTKPWATCSVACGTAFFMVFMCVGMPCLILPLKPVLFFSSVFVAVYKSAARGGEY